MTDGRKIVRSNGQCINQLIREERMRLEDIEWETGVRPSEGWLCFLMGEKARGIITHYDGLE